MYRYLVTILISVIFLFIFPTKQLSAQLGIGVSYEKREVSSENTSYLPEYGFGIRVENDFGPKIPLIKLGWRLHASAFSLEESFNEQLNEVLDRNVNAVVADVGFSLFIEVKMPLFINPYAGGGLGFETRKDVRNILVPTPQQNESSQNQAFSFLPSDIKGNSIYYHGFIGMKFSPIPILKPFVEYRYSHLTEVGDLNNIPGRLLFGVTLEF